MKIKFKSISLLLIVGVLLFPVNNFAQKFTGQGIVAFGAGSVSNKIIEDGFAKTFKPTGLSLKFKPVYNFAVDYGVSDKLSFGINLSNHESIATYTGYTGNDSITKPGSFKDGITCIGVGIRMLYHMGDNDDFDPYFGLRGTYMSWNYKTNTPHGFKQDYIQSNLGTAIKPQIMLGFRYFFSDKFGINLEAALGQTYNTMLSLNYRFGGY